MIATLRRQHGGGRDFLQENKQRVSKMETNGRCLAAAGARRVPLWRPVALHYADKLRPPHLNFGGVQRRPRLGHEPSAPNSELRSGLAQPYMGSVSGGRATKPALAPPCNHELTRRRQAEQQEQARLQGGWVDPRRKERPVKRCCHQECQCHQALPEVPVSVPQPMKLGEGDQAEERLSQCPSRITRASQRERRFMADGEGNVEPEAPLSARSSASALNHKSKRSVSQESNRSNVTVKSNVTVASTKTNASKQSSASKHTISSKKSQLSRKSGPMEEMPLPEYQEREQREHQSHQHSEPKGQEVPQVPHQDYEGYTPLTLAQRQAARDDAQLKYGKLMEEYNHLPVSAPTLRVRSRRIAIEKQLDELDYAINMFDQPHMEMYYKQ